MKYFILFLFSFILIQSQVNRRFTFITGSNRRGALGTSSPILPKTTLTGFNITSICGGTNHILITTSNNGVFVWGDNSLLSLGVGSSDPGLNIWTPRQLFSNDSNYIISCGVAHSHVYKNMNEIFSFGSSTFFQTGSGNSTATLSPTIIPNLISRNYTRIFTTSFVGFAKDNNNNLFGWGRNEKYQLGAFQTTVNQPNPVYLFNISITQAYGGPEFSTFLGENGRVYASGSNNNGELGQGNTNLFFNLVEVANLTNIVTLYSYGTESLAATSTSLFGWGLNNFDQLGFTRRINTLPVLVNAPSGVVQISMSTHYSLILTSTGDVYSCGFNNTNGINNGQLGHNNFLPLSTFTKINFGTTKMKLILAESATAFAVDLNGNLWAWGNIDKFGINPFEITPRQIITQTFDKVFAGNDVSMATRLSNGEPWGWGKNANLIIDNRTSNDIFLPQQIIPLIGVNISDISIGGDSNTAFVLAVNGMIGRLTTLVYAWGTNSFFQTGHDGNGGTPPDSIPVSLLTETFALFNSNVTVRRISAGASHSVVTSIDNLATNLNLNVWGDNQNGQIGLGNQLSKAKKTAIGNVINDGVAGDYHTIYSTTQGALFVTGLNNNGQIGMQNLIRISQVSVNNSTRNLNILRVWAGAFTSFFWTTDGLYVTGDNTRGALGLVNATIFTSLVKHTFNTFHTEGILKISSARHGGHHTLVLTNLGKIFVMGANEMGQLGLGHTNDVFTPVQYRPSGISPSDLGLDVAAGRQHSIYLFGSKLCPNNCSPQNIPKGACDTVIGVCNCFTGFFGADCSLFQCDDPICSGHGTCDSTVGECVCDRGFTGNTCNRRKCPNNCSGHGICDSTTGSCNCDPNWNVDSDCGTRNNAITSNISLYLILIISIFFFF